MATTMTPTFASSTQGRVDVPVTGTSNGGEGAPSAVTGRRSKYRIRRAAWVVVAVSIAVGVAGAGQALGAPAVPSAVVAAALGLEAWIWSGRHRRSRRRLLGAVGVAGLLLVGLAATSWSYTSYLTAPGAATAGVRTGDWMRDHGMNPVVDRLEQRLYPGPKLTNGRVDPNQLPIAAPGRSHAAASAAPSKTAPVALPKAAQAAMPPAVSGLLDASLPGEGTWSPSTRTANGHPVTYTTFLRPDPTHTSVVASAVWLNPEATKVTYVPGTKQGTGWAWNSGIPASERPNVVAAFNAGFKFKDIPGGYMTEGRSPSPLIDGQASLVLHANGVPELGAWGTQVKMSPDVTSVVQNLRLIVDNSTPDPRLGNGADRLWGKQKWQLQYTNRSGLGITDNGALIYVAGSNLTTKSLGQALAKAGSVRAMELDIHATNPTFNFLSPTPGNPGSLTGTKLVPGLTSAADRYLEPSQRDFFTVTTTSAAGGPK